MEKEIKKLVDDHGFAAVLQALAEIAERYSAPKLAENLSKIENQNWA
jgi:hypothetical protein